MTEDELMYDAINRLRALQELGDIEVAHCDADNVLCDFLDGIGFCDVANEFRKIEKWYA